LIAVDDLVKLLGELPDVELGPQREVVADLLFSARRVLVLEHGLAEGNDVRLAAEGEGRPVDPGDLVVGGGLGEVRVEKVHPVGHDKPPGLQGSEELVRERLDVEVAHHEEVPIEHLAALHPDPGLDEVCQALDLLPSLLFLLFGAAAVDVDIGDDEVEASSSKRGAVGHPVQLVTLVGGGRHLEADLADEAGADDGSFVVEKGEALVVPCGIGNEDLVVAREQALQSAEPAQVRLDLLQRNEIEPLADVCDVLQGPPALAVGEVSDVPGGDEEVLVHLARRYAVGPLIHELHEAFSFASDGEGLVHKLCPSEACGG